MPVVGPAWLPSEFVEITSARMLIAPVSQYLYASMIYMADMQAQLRLDPSAFEWVNGRGVPANAGGAPVPGLDTMRLMLADPIRAGAIVVSDELATQPGSVVKINRPVFSGGGYTVASRTLGTGVTFSTTPIALTGEQVPITILRLGGPFASGGTVPQPYGIDRFQAMQSVHSLAARVGLHMQYDRDAFIDNVVATLIDNPASGNVLYPNDPTNSISSDSSAFTANVNGDRPFDYETITRMVAKMRSTNIPTFDDGRYRLIINPAQEQQLLMDPVFRNFQKEMDASNPLVNGYVKTVGRDVEIYASNSNTVDTTTVSGVTINHAVMFGKEIVGRVRDREGCRIALSSDDNYGETAKAMWLSYEGFALLDNRFVVSAHSN